MKRIGLIVGILLIVGLVVAAITVSFKGKKTPSTNNNTSQNSGNSSSNIAPTSVKTVTITGDGFSPQSLTVKVGTVVKWLNKDTAQHTITSTSDNGPASTAFGTNIAYSFAFKTAGTYDYNSMVDSDNANFTGTITVTE